MGSLVSIIIPAYNCAKYLPDAIESALNQTHPRVEVIVVNDGSPDNTDEVVAPYRDRIIYHKQTNRGLSASRNVGVMLSKGEFLNFLDADDFLYPTKIERQLAVFAAKSDAGVVISGYDFIEEDGKRIMSSVHKPWNGDGFERLMRHESFACHAALLRRDVFERSMRFSEDIPAGEYQEDWQLWIDMVLDGVQFYSRPEPLCAYRYREGAGSRNLLKHNDGARRVVRWLRNDPRAQKYRTEVERLAAIVEMERVGRAWRIGEKDIAAQTLLDAVAANPRFWRETLTFRRLYEHAASVRPGSNGSPAAVLQCMEETIVEGILDLVRERMDDGSLRSLRATAFLWLADAAYGLGDGELARTYARRALHESKAPLFAPYHYPTLVRSALGPTVGGVVGALLRAITSKM